MHPYRIIIAEDYEALATVLERFIVRHYPGATVPTFHNGQHALDAYDQTGADLLVVNHAMPGMTGPTIIRTLRARGDSVPIIGISGSPGNRQEYMDAGAQAFICGADIFSELPTLLRRFLPPRERAR